MNRQNKMLVRVTQIESFRRYMEQSDYANFEITEESVIEGISGGFVGNEYTRVGTAFHSIVETGCLGERVDAGVRDFTYYNKPAQEPVPDGYRFDVDGFSVVLDDAQCNVALSYRNEHPQAFHEHRLYKDFGDCIVTGCLDMIDGIEVHDIKTKYSTPSDAEYLNSCQWRFYLEMSGLDVFNFDLFCFDGYKVDKHGYDVRGLPLTRHQPPITCYRYDGMETDNHRLLGQFLEWVHLRGLEQYLINQTV